MGDIIASREGPALRPRPHDAWRSSPDSVGLRRSSLTPSRSLAATRAIRSARATRTDDDEVKAWAVALLWPLGVALALTAVGVALSCLAFSYSGYHAYVQDVSGDRAGSVLALTNLCGILMGIAGNILSGYLMEFTGSFSLMFFLTGAMFISSGLAWAALMKGDVLF